jgi:hypothetical protein
MTWPHRLKRQSSKQGRKPNGCAIQCFALPSPVSGQCEKFADPNRKFRCESTSLRVEESSGRILRDGEPGGVSPYRIDGARLIEFIAFLRECGGAFEIH